MEDVTRGPQASATIADDEGQQAVLEGVLVGREGALNFGPS
jgi:hypothetical protein